MKARTRFHAIIAGERNPQVLAAMADSRCKNSQETIAKSLVGNWNQAFLFQLKQSMELYDTYQERINALDKEVEKVLSAYTALSGKDLSQIPREAKSRSKKNGFAFDSEKYAYAIFGVTAIPAMRHITMEQQGRMGAQDRGTGACPPCPAWSFIHPGSCCRLQFHYWLYRR